MTDLLPDVSEVTATLLDEMFEKNVPCTMIVEWDIGLVLFRWRRSKTCRKMARHMIVVRCSLHGTERRGICHPHLLMLKAMPGALLCVSCDEPVRWIQ